MSSGAVLICDGCGASVTKKTKMPKPLGWRRLNIYGALGESKNTWAADICSPTCAAKVVFDTLSDEEAQTVRPAEQVT